MTNFALLNNVDHHDLRVIARHGAEFGDAANQMLVFPTEFESVQREYPILFRRDQQGEWRSVALLGLGRDENLFLGEAGWEARHVPLIQQRGPFSIVLQPREDAEPEPMIRVDLDDPRISRTEGIPLFLPHGGNSPYLERLAGVLRAVFLGNQVMAPMFAAFEAAGLLRPVALDLKLEGDTTIGIADVFTIDEERLAALDGAALETLHRSGFLRSAFLAAASFGNIQRLIELKNRRRGGE